MTEPRATASAAHTPQAPLQWRPGADVVVRQMGETAVLIHLQTNRIFELDAIGARVWALIADGLDEPAIVARLGEEFEGDPARVAADVRSLIQDLQREELVRPCQP